MCESLRSAQRAETTLQVPGGKGPVDYKETLPGVWVENRYTVYLNRPVVGLGLQELETRSSRAGKQTMTSVIWQGHLWLKVSSAEGGLGC